MAWVSKEYSWYLITYHHPYTHRSKKVREALLYHPRIMLVSLPTTRSPELNLIEVKCGCSFRGLQHGVKNAI
jgi:hypothetical protein